MVIRFSLVQLQTPDEMRGRVSAVNALFIGTSNQLGEFESGAVAALVGAVPSVVIGGCGTIAVALDLDVAVSRAAPRARRWKASWPRSHLVVVDHQPRRDFGTAWQVRMNPRSISQGSSE